MSFAHLVFENLYFLSQTYQTNRIKVFAEPNLVTTPVVLTRDQKEHFAHNDSSVHIEGEVTPKKLQMAQEFESIFRQATSEVLELAAFKPSEAVEDFLEENPLTESQIAQIKMAEALTVFNFHGKIFIKTRDNKIEPVSDYCFRLERAFLNQIKAKNEAVLRISNDLAQAVETINDYRKRLESRSLLLRVKATYANLKIKVLNLFANKEQ